MNAAEHFEWAKGRALEYLDIGDMPAAMASLISDLGKHKGTEQIMHPDLQGLLVGEYLLAGGEGVRRFITGLAGPGAG